MVARRVVRGTISGGAVASIRARRGGKGAVAESGMDGKVVELDVAEDYLSYHLKGAPAVFDHHRKDDYLHVSDLLGKCVRRLALLHVMGMSVPPERLSDVSGLTFAQGDVIHDYVKRRVQHGAPDKVWGHWECRCGATRTAKPSTYREVDGKLCGKCGLPLDRYAEAKIVDSELHITGSPDLILRIPDNGGFFHITEIKSISGELFKELVRPKPEHVLQVAFYWHLMQRKGYSLASSASILYVNKANVMFKSPYREFSVQAADSVKRLEPYIEDARAYKAALDGGPLPLRTICATQDTSTAKKCSVCTLCFSRK